MKKYIWISLIILVLFVALGFYVANSKCRSAETKFCFGLDLVGGTELIYNADTSNTTDKNGAMESLKEVIERRVNTFGVSEPLIQTEQAGIVSGNPTDRLLVELPGVTDLDEAVRLIGQTPTLEFKLPTKEVQTLKPGQENFNPSDLLVSTGLTGQYLEKAKVEFDPNTGSPYISLMFNEEGGALFAEITKNNIGTPLAIILDGEVLSAPVIRDQITNGEAQITGFAADEARNLARNLNYGALPVPITLSASQTIGASLGEIALTAGVRAGIIGFIGLSLFLIFWYRLPGLVSVVALVGYIILSLAAFKLIPVTLTAAGIAGFILSIGMAVDANVLIFERTKEELKKGRSVHDSLHEGFHRAWLSIRDSNIASIITAIVLFWLGTSAVKGFALTLGVGVLISMFTAITVSRSFLFAIAPPSTKDSRLKRFLFSNGLYK